VDASSALAFTLAAIAIELTPGPNMVWLALVALTEGRRAGLAAVAGVGTGLALVGMAVAFGLGALVANTPTAYQILRFAGIGYLLWLAWEAWRSTGQASPDYTDFKAGFGKHFLRGVITNVLNPKAFLFYVAILPAFLASPATPSATALLCAIYVVVATAIHAGIVLAANAARDILHTDAHMKTVGRASAAVLVMLAVWLLAKT
jgi:threonine/homoserine/homoserine lactone efflux protein